MMIQLTRRHVLGLLGGAGALRQGIGIDAAVAAPAGETPLTAAVRAYRNAVAGYALISPHGPCTDMLVHFLAWHPLEQLMLKAKLHGAAVDEDRFWDLIDLTRTERYFEDPAWAHHIHVALQGLCGGGPRIAGPE